MVIGIDARLWDQTGVGRYIRNLVINLLKIDKKNTYVLFVKKSDLESVEKLSQERLKIVIADIKWHSLKEQLNLSKILEKEKVDIMHFPYFSIPLSYRKPFVITIHDLIIDHFPTGQASTLPLSFYHIKRLAYKFISKNSARNAKKIIVPSVATRDEVMDHLKVKEDKIVITYEGFDKGISKSPRVIEGTPEKSYFLYVGNAYPHKNLETLVKAFEKLRLEVNDLKLILVGKEDFFYKRLKEKTADKNVVFYGEATDSELHHLYEKALALVAPSLMEGFGLPVLEAMGERTLVICSNIPSFKEVANDCAIYFDPLSSEDLKEELKKVYNNKKAFAELVEKGYKRAGDFSWEKMARETLNVYESSVSIR
jgi:glycosyltransferase involved in cell wall biosynthesis